MVHSIIFGRLEISFNFRVGWSHDPLPELSEIIATLTVLEPVVINVYVALATWAPVLPPSTNSNRQVLEPWSRVVITWSLLTISAVLKLF